MTKQYFGILTTTVNDEYHERKIFDDRKLLQTYLNNMITAAELLQVKLTYSIEDFEGQQLPYSESSTGMRNFGRRLKLVPEVQNIGPGPYAVEPSAEDVIKAHIKQQGYDRASNQFAENQVKQRFPKATDEGYSDGTDILGQPFFP